MSRFLITSALPYANGPIHFGHIAGAYLPGDCFSRFQRLKGEDVLYICGSDEYGIAITLSAELAKRTPKEHVDIYHKENMDIFNKLNFSFDHYSRTTWEGHKETVHQFFLDLCDNGYIEKKVENHLFSKKENRFLADRYVIGTCPKCGFDKARGDECQKCGASYEASDLINPKSKLTKDPLCLKPSKHWYLRFDKFKDELTEWINTKNWKPNVISFTKKYIEDLKPRCITRDLYWGIELPIASEEGKVLYVWFDAPIGYISATKQWAEKIGKKDKWKEYWQDDKTKLIHFIGKDNIPFHTVFFPAMIMGQSTKYILPNNVPANEFLMLEGRQFSKSDNWYIDIQDFFSKYTSDQIRYYLAYNAPEKSDTEFSWDDFQVKCNSNLLGKLGNFVNRVLVFAKNNLESKVPESKDLHDDDNKFLADINRFIDISDKSYSSFELKKAAVNISNLCDLANVYFDAKKPWELIKKDKQNAKNVIFCCIECVKALCLISSPIIPKTSNKIWEMLGYQKKLTKSLWKDIKDTKIEAGQKLLEPVILFKKIEDKDIEAEKEKLYKKTTNIEKKEEISFKDFEKIDLRVVKIIDAQKIEKSKKLLKLKIDIGGEVKDVISGIANSFKVEDLIGKKVLALINLKPAKIMGHLSEAMLLLAGEDSLEFAEFKDSKEGSSIR